MLKRFFGWFERDDDDGVLLRMLKLCVTIYLVTMACGFFILLPFPKLFVIGMQLSHIVGVFICLVGILADNL